MQSIPRRGLGRIVYERISGVSSREMLVAVSRVNRLSAPQHADGSGVAPRY